MQAWIPNLEIARGLFTNLCLQLSAKVLEKCFTSEGTAGYRQGLPGIGLEVL